MRRNLFTIAPGAPFLETFVDALLKGEIIASISRDFPPLTLARTTIYVPTQRAARALIAQFAQAFNERATLLPRILPLGGMEEQESVRLFTEWDASLDAMLAPPIEELERRLLLSQLVMQWSRVIGRAIISVDPSGAPQLHDTEPFLVAASPANAYALAADLGALIDEFIIEDIAPEAIAQLNDAAFDQFWAITTKFLEIALKDWPAILLDRKRVDAALRQKRLTEAQIAALEHDQDALPVIALGSTGAHPTTARLLAVIAARKNGAVVLPGLDQTMSDSAWARIGVSESRDEPAYTHPQSVMKRLLAVVGAHRDEARELGVLAPALGARRALVAQALAPADETAHWRDYRAAQSASFEEALAGVAFVEAPDERLEAMTLALFMREALETPHRIAALITPDRNLARRVAAELRRFHIDIDDSGGMPLAATRIGVLARLAATVASEGAHAVNVAALLAHPLAAFGLSRAQVAALAPMVEIGVLRVIGPDARGLAEMVAAARGLTKSRHAHPASQRIDDKNWRDIEDLLTRVDAAFVPDESGANRGSLQALSAAHRASLEAILAGADGESEEGASELFDILARLAAAEAPEGFDASSYAALFDNIAFETILRGPRRAHPRLKILGPLEARLMEADLLLLAGLDEGVWPPQTDTGAFLNRSMRAQLGLTPPERRIGQSAHDFMMALGAKNVVLSRALKRDGAPTVASRFVTRLVAFAGEAVAPCKARGAKMLAVAEALDRPIEAKSIARPAPRPAAKLRPQKLSVTRIERLRRDPYAIYAEHILKLAPLAPLGAESGAREIGTAIHDAIAQFILLHPKGALPEKAPEILRALARDRLKPLMGDAAFLIFQWPRLQAGLDIALAFEKDRRFLNPEIFVETQGAWRMLLKDGGFFTLTAIADRIEVDPAGHAHVFDYKTGKTPTARQIEAGWSSQLTLEAAMIEAGAFPAVGARPVESAAYIALGHAKTQEVGNAKAMFVDLVVKHREELLKLLDQFSEEATPYVSKPHVAFISEPSDFDHLARVREWTRGGGE